MKTKTKYIGAWLRPEGYFGKLTPVWLVFDPETKLTLEVHPAGVHRSGIPPCIDAAEVEWMVENHPTWTKFYRAMS